MGDLREKLRIDLKPLEEINSFLLNPSNTIINQLLKVIDKHGGVEEINRKAAEAGKLENLMARLQAAKSPYVKDLDVAHRTAGPAGLHLHDGLCQTGDRGPRGGSLPSTGTMR